MEKVICGNVSNLGKDTGGWIIGHFLDNASPFKNQNFEVKFYSHPLGDYKANCVNKAGKSICILLSGKFKFMFGSREIILGEEGAYVYWDAGVSHSWEALEKSTTLTIRWPSVPMDQKMLKV